MKKICNWFIHNASMQKKLIISYIILVSIPLCILGIHSFSAANQNLLDQTEVTMDNNLHRMCQEADAIFQRETDFTKYLAYNLEFRQTLEGNAYNGSAIAQSLNKTVEPVFWYFITSDENLKMIKIVTPNTASDIGSFLESAEPYEDTVWYKKHEKDFNICQNDNMISINSAIEVDLFGQVCAESIGTKHMSGSGGQIDFVRGACQSKGGKSFIAFASTTKGTISKICASLTPGAVCTTSKNDVDYVVTEYGIAHLRGQSLASRARQLISIAHPDFRDELMFEAKKRGIMI